MFQARSIPAPAPRSAPMDPPGITRRRRPRRPFLAPLWVISLAILAAVGAALLILHSAGTTVVVLVQEGAADAEDNGQRARHLAAMFGSQGGSGHLDALYVSDAQGAEQTVAPLAELLGEKPLIVPRDDPEATASRVMDEHEGDTVLVLGTADTLPDLIQQLSGIEVQPTQGDVGYVLSIPSIGRANLVRFTY